MPLEKAPPTTSQAMSLVFLEKAVERARDAKMVIPPCVQKVLLSRHIQNAAKCKDWVRLAKVLSCQDSQGDYHASFWSFVPAETKGDLQSSGIEEAIRGILTNISSDSVPKKGSKTTGPKPTLNFDPLKEALQALGGLTFGIPPFFRYEN